ncbi:glycoside hydrolase family 18 [Bacteroides sp.]|uniref:glycoside hydrolase family 18 n=1 Tax=Bacteroides sp. TaxID=29523 RepID=UPI0025C4F0D6|nr:glycoside hydrolase family 18 [Bacteroides sp.]
MKALRKLLYLLSLTGLMAITSCTDVENIEMEHIGGYNTMGDNEYFANLRAYKETAKNYGRPVAFGWYSNWSPGGAYRRGYLTSMPDSMDLVSMWSGTPGRYDITPEQKADKEFVQKVKGTKLMEVCLLSHMGKGRTPGWVYADVEKQAEEEGWSKTQLEVAKRVPRWKFWGFEGELESENHYECLAKFAKALCDSLYTGEWDGYDIDWEIGSGVFDMDGTLQSTKHIIYVVKEMNKYIGPKSDPEGKGHKLICIDGSIYSLTRELDEYVDYWITQSYGSSKPSLEGYGVDPKKIITTENFESSAASGGGLLQQAANMPSKGYKGGVGAYRFDNDYDNTPDYKWMRQAIQINQQVFNEWKANQNKEEGEPQE